jgi:ribosomal protein S18 acetylase RimI-like enzyme
MKTNQQNVSIEYRQAVLADATGMAAVHAGRAERDGIDPFCSLEDNPTALQFQTALEKAERENRLDHWLVAQALGQVVGLGLVDSWLEGDGTWVYLVLGWVLPEWRGQGIGTQLLQRMEATARQLAARDHPGEKFELAGNASSTELDSTVLLLNEGYSAAYTVLEFDLPPDAVVSEHPLPAGVEVRPVLPEHLRSIAECVDACYRDEFDQGRFLDEFNVEWYAQRLAQPPHDLPLYQVAWAGDQIIGQVLSVVEAGSAEVFEVSVLPAWRRKGVARALLGRTLGELRKRGTPVIRLHTVAEFKTRARDLYQSVGFRRVKEFPRYRKPIK